MSNISANINLTNSTAGLNFNTLNSYESLEESSYVKVTTITSTAEVLDYDTILDPKFIGISHEGTAGDLLVSFDGVDYDQQVSGQEMLLIRLRNSDKTQQQTVTTVADVSGDLNGKYFTMDGNSGTWAVWINEYGTAPEPAHGQTNSVEISSILLNDTAAAVAAAIVNDLSASTAFTNDFTIAYNAAVDDDLITITDKTIGVRTSIADATAPDDTGFTFATTQTGTAVTRVIYLKSDSVDIEAGISVMPN